MNNISKEKKLSAVAVVMTVIFGILFLFSLLGTLLLTQANPSNGMLFMCMLCFTPALGFYFAISKGVAFSARQKMACLIISALAFVVLDVIYFIVLNGVKDLLGSSLSIGGSDPVATYVLSALTGQISYVFLFFKLCRSEKKILEALCIPVSVLLPILSVALAIVVIIVVGVFIIVTLFKLFVGLRNATDIGGSNWYDQTFTINDGGQVHTLKHYGRDLMNNAEEFTDEFNNRWITQDQGRTFYRK